MPFRLYRPSPKLWLFLLLLGVGGILAVLDLQDVGLPGPIPRDDSGEPDYYLENATLTRFDEQGRAHQRLETPRLVHTPHDDVTRTQQPVARFLDSDERIWFGRGDTGILGPEGVHLILEGNARLNAPSEGWQLDTETLHVDTQRGHAWSETEAVLQQPPQRIRGERFEAWFNESRMRLTDNVRGFHPPQDQEVDSP